MGIVISEGSELSTTVNESIQQLLHYIITEAIKIESLCRARP